MVSGLTGNRIREYKSYRAACAEIPAPINGHKKIPLLAADVYRVYLEEYHRWLGRDPYDRPQKVALYEVVADILATAGSEHWGQGGHNKEDFPHVEELEAALGIKDRGPLSYYQQFSNTYTGLTGGMKVWAEQFVSDMRKAEVKKELEEMSGSDRKELMEHTYDELEKTEWGREAMATLGRDVNEPYHPLKLFSDNTLDSYVGSDRRFDFARNEPKDVMGAARQSVALFSKFVPAFLVMVRPSQDQLRNLRIVGRSLTELASRFVSVPAAMSARYTDTSHRLNELVKAFERDAGEIASKLRRWGNARASGLENLKRFGALGGAVAALGNLVEFLGTGGRAVIDPTKENNRAAALSALKAVNDVNALVENLQTAFGKLDDPAADAGSAAKGAAKTTRKITLSVVLEILGPIGDAVDAYISGVAAHDRYEAGDRSAAFGHTLQVVGAGIGVAAGLAGLSAKLVGAGSGVMASGVGLLVGAFAVAIGLLGFAIVALTSDSQLVLLLKNCLFGTEWPGDDSFYENPDKDYFKWQTTAAEAQQAAQEADVVPSRTTRTNAARQTSTILSRVTGLHVTLSDAQPQPDPPTHYYDGTTRIQWVSKSLNPATNDEWPYAERTLSFDAPEEFSDDSYVLIKRVEERGDAHKVVPLWYVQFGEPEQPDPNEHNDTEIYGFRKPDGSGRFDTPPVLVHHAKTNEPDTKRWTLRILSSHVKPNGTVSRQWALDHMFGKSKSPPYLEIDVIPGDIGSPPGSETVERILGQTDEMVVYRDRVEVS